MIEDITNENFESSIEEENDLIKKIDDTSDIIEQPKNEVGQVSKEVMDLVKTLDVKNQMSIVDFGRVPSEKVSTIMDKMLHDSRKSDLEDTSKTLKSLGKIMSTFDKNDIKTKKNFLTNLINNIQKKYERMDKDILDITAQLNLSEEQLRVSNMNLEELYNETYQYYLELQNHIQANQITLDEMKLQLPDVAKKAESGDDDATFELNNLNYVISLLEQKAYDLELSKQVAMQTAPQIRILQQSNSMLSNKIKNSLITTLPIFKQGLIVMIKNKENRMVIDSVNAMDKAASEVYKNSAMMTAETAKNTARLSGQTVLSSEDIIESYDVIIKGINEANEISEQISATRKDGLEKLQNLEFEMKQNQMKKVD